MNNNNELLEILQLCTSLIKIGIVKEAYTDIVLPKMPERLVYQLEELIENLKGKQK